MYLICLFPKHKRPKRDLAHIQVIPKQHEEPAHQELFMAKQKVHGQALKRLRVTYHS